MKEKENLLNYQDREIKRLTNMLYTTTKHADKLNEENNKLNKELKKCKQSQKQLAISELEKVKEYNHTLSLCGSPYIDVFINNQIKSLKGGANE